VLHVGPDSGVIHLASALNVPTVAIFRRYSDMADFIPVGPKHIYFDAPCPCMNSKNPACAAVVKRLAWLASRSSWWAKKFATPGIGGCGYTEINPMKPPFKPTRIFDVERHSAGIGDLLRISAAWRVFEKRYPRPSCICCY